MVDATKFRPNHLTEPVVVRSIGSFVTLSVEGRLIGVMGGSSSRASGGPSDPFADMTTAPTMTATTPKHSNLAAADERPKHFSSSTTAVTWRVPS